MLGAKVLDKVTGFVGIVTCTSTHITGCRRAWVEGPTNEKGETQERWIDEARLEVVDPAAVKLNAREIESRPAPSNVGHPRG